MCYNISNVLKIVCHSGIFQVFGYGSSKTTAVDNVTFNCYEDQITILVGQNGAGKSTLVHMLTGKVTRNYRHSCLDS